MYRFCRRRLGWPTSASTYRARIRARKHSRNNSRRSVSSTVFKSLQFISSPAFFRMMLSMVSSSSGRGPGRRPTAAASRSHAAIS